MSDKDNDQDIMVEDLLQRAGDITNPNMKSSAHLAIDRFMLGMSLNPAGNEGYEELRNALTEEEKH